MEQLCKQYLKAKAKEAEAKEARLVIEKEIIANCADAPLEGSKSLVPGGRFKLTVTTKLNRKLDFDAYRAMDLPENIQFVDLKPAINLKKLRAVEMVDPVLVAACVTTKPAKTSIKVTEVE